MAQLLHHSVQDHLAHHIPSHLLVSPEEGIQKDHPQYEDNKAKLWLVLAEGQVMMRVLSWQVVVYSSSKGHRQLASIFLPPQVRALALLEPAGQGRASGSSGVVFLGEL